MHTMYLEILLQNSSAHSDVLYLKNKYKGHILILQVTKLSALQEGCLVFMYVTSCCCILCLAWFSTY